MFQLRDVIRAVDWTPPYIAFLFYTFIIISYQFTGADIALVAALLTLPFGQRSLRFPPFVLCFMLLVGWAYVCWSTSEWKALSWDATYKFAKVFIMTSIAVNAVRSRAQVRCYVLFLLGTIALFPVRGALFNYFLYSATTGGRVAWNYIFENPNDLAGLLLFPLSLCLGIWGSEQKRHLLWWSALAGLVVIPLVIVFTQSRGGTLALLFLLGLAFMGNKRGGRLAVVAMAALGIVLMLAPPGALTRIGTLKETTNTGQLGRIDDAGSSEQRYEIWKVARTIFAEHALTGVGFGAYPQKHFETATRPNFGATARGYRDPHSTYLGILAESGVLGFGIFAGIVGSVLVGAERVRRQAVLLLPGGAQQLLFAELGFVSLLIAAIFGTYGSLALFYLYLGTLYVMGESLREEVSALPGASAGAPASARRSGLRGSRRVSAT